MAVPARRHRTRIEKAIAQMVAALDAEIAAIRERTDETPKRVGTRLTTLPKGAVYRFPGSSPGECSPGRLITLELASGDTLTARPVGGADEGLTLLLPRDLGTETPKVRIHTDTSWLNAALRDVLRDLGSVPRTARLLLDPRQARTSTASWTGRLRGAASGLNREQTEAVRRAVGSEMQFVWGPPGTGKTRTLARIVEALHAEGRSVLLVAPSNLAVDHLLHAVADRLAGGSALREHRVLRVGPIKSGSLRRRYGKQVDLDRVARRQAGPGIRKKVRNAMAEVRARLTHAEDEVGEELRRRLGKDFVRLRARSRRRNAKIEKRREQLLKRARIVGTTLHRAYLPGQLDGSYDAIVVDEASAASFPHVFAAACRARNRVIVAGDPRQLSPVVESDDRRAKKWLGHNAFQAGGFVEPAEDGNPPSVLSCLTDQYRMHPEICELVSAYAYKGRLRTAQGRTHVQERPRLLGGERVALIDTGPLAPALLQMDDSSGPSRANPWHRFIISRLLEQRTARDPGNARKPEVALLTPYKQQVKHLRGAFGDTHNVAIRTVHKSQGQEWDVVILDLPQTEGPPPSPFSWTKRLNEDGARLLTVGTSRARHQLVIVADCQYYGEHGLGGSAIARLLDRLEEDDRKIDGRKLLGEA